jgi:predicted nucleic acid-binding protein
LTVVVDACLALKWSLEEEDTKDALALWDQWQDSAEEVIAPPIFRSEVTNVLFRRVRRAQVRLDDAASILDFLINIVAIREPSPLYGRALTLAESLGQGSAYDTLYLALAELHDCEMWTADRRFVRSAQTKFPRVRWIGEYRGEAVA